MDQLSHNLPRIGVAAVIRDTHGRVLLVERAADPEAGTWALPGGSVELGEPLAAAVCREAQEETGLDVTVRDLLHVAEIVDQRAGQAPPFHFVVLDYGCEVRGGFLAPGSDARQGAWFGPGELGTLTLTTGMAECLASAAVREFLGW
jgi:8-oxo-dGTP diphosphatase